MSRPSLYFDASVLQYPDYRGVHVYALSLLSEMAALEPDVNFHLHFGMSGWNDALNELVALPNVHVHKFGGRLGRHIVPPINIFRTKSTAYCVLNGNTGKIRIPVPCATAAVFHDMRLIRYPEWYGAEKVRRFTADAEKWIRRLNLIITGSHTVKQEIVDYFAIDPDRIAVVCEGCDHRSGSGIGSKPAALPSDTPYFLTVNPSDIRKNLRFVLDGFAEYIKVKPEDRNSKLVIAGVIEDRAYYEQWYRLNPVAAARTISLGYIAGDELIYLFRNAIASVYVSLYEGFGIPIIEAYRLNCPVILSDIPVFREVAQDAGIFVTPNDTTQLAQAMWSMRSDDSIRDKYTKLGGARATVYRWQPSARIAVDALLSL